LIGLPTIILEVDSYERGTAMSLSFTIGEFRDMTRREFYRMALRAILAAGRCSPGHEERLILQLRRVEEARS
jgi:hypothetical protein